MLSDLGLEDRRHQLLRVLMRRLALGAFWSEHRPNHPVRPTSLNAPFGAGAFWHVPFKTVVIDTIES